MEFGTFRPPEVTHSFGDKHTHDSDHADCLYTSGGLININKIPGKVGEFDEDWRLAILCGESRYYGPCIAVGKVTTEMPHGNLLTSARMMNLGTGLHSVHAFWFVIMYC